MCRLGFLFSIFVIETLLFSSCNKDACEDKNCQNQSVCIDGNCNCKEGYVGDLCEQEIEPRKIILHSIQIKDFPSRNSDGDTWDVGSNADITVAIFDLNGIIWQMPVYYSDATPVRDIWYKLDTAYTFTNVKAPLEFGLYDFDFQDGFEWMGSMLFSPYTSGFPNPRVLRNANAEVELELEYVW